MHSSRFATGVNDTGGKWKKPSSRKIFIILFGHLWVLELTYIYIFAFKFTLRCLQPDIDAIICHRCRWHRWQFATGFVDTGGKFAGGIVDTSGKFATSVNNASENGGKNCHRCLWYRWQICHRCPWYRRRTLTHEYLREFSKKFETVSMEYSGAGGKLIHEKNQMQKISCHCPFKQTQVCSAPAVCQVISTTLAAPQRELWPQFWQITMEQKPTSSHFHYIAPLTL